MRSRTDGTSPRVVLAEDDAELRRLVAAALRADGVRVEEAANGSEMLEALEDAARKQEPVDVVITDVRMPGLTGLQALDWLDRVRAWRPKTIVITAFPDPMTTLRAEQLGVHLVAKPFELDDLRSLVRALVSVESVS